MSIIVPPYSWEPDAWKPIPTGNPQKPYCLPTVYFPVWVDPNYRMALDGTGETLFRRIEELFWNVGRVSSIGFYHADYEQSRWRLHLTTPTDVYNKSREWKQYEGGHGSTYFAVHPEKRDIWTGAWQKDFRTPLNAINAVRVPGHAWMTAMGWPEQAYPNERADLTQCCGMRNPLMSLPIRYLPTNVGIDNPGLAGFDRMEIGWFQSFSGPPWVWKQE